MSNLYRFVWCTEIWYKILASAALIFVRTYLCIIAKVHLDCSCVGKAKGKATVLTPRL